MGCVDVMPFVPIKDATNDDCIRLLRETVGQRIADEAGLPVFLYEMSARKEARKTWLPSERDSLRGWQKSKGPGMGTGLWRCQDTSDRRSRGRRRKAASYRL